MTSPAVPCSTRARRSPASASDGRGRLWRARWAAIGAAVCVSIGAGGAVRFAGAVDSPDGFVAVTPARILDSRDPVDLGLAGPFASPVSLDLQVTGQVPTATGPATVVPPGATGVVLNVTAVHPSADGFVSIRPADAVGPIATSNLNVRRGEVVPNSVTVALPTSGPDAGRIEITYDAYGAAGPSVDILVDVVGYTTDSGIAGLQAQIDALVTSNDALVAANDAQQTKLDVLHNARTIHAGGNQNIQVNTQNTVVREVTVPVPANGVVSVTSTATVYAQTTDATECSITVGTTVDSAYAQVFGGDYLQYAYGQLTGTRVFPVQQGFNVTYRLVCRSLGGTALISDSALTAVYTAGG